MDDTKSIDRREFTLHSAMAILGGVAITVSGCSSDSPMAPTPTPTPTDETGVVGTNHGHTAVITSAQLTAGNMISLDITGAATHPHTVELSSGEVGQIANGTQVRSKDSTTNAGHSHTVIFN